MSAPLDMVIRPAAVLSETAARHILAGLAASDISCGGLWSVTPTLWQRYDRPWDGPSGMRGTARQIGSVAVVYDSPQKHSITVYRVSLTQEGSDQGWTTESLCNEPFAYAGLTLADCPRAPLVSPPRHDPFHVWREQGLRLSRPLPDTLKGSLANPHRPTGT
jgi:hypothetical protein